MRPLGSNIPGSGYIMADMATPEQNALDLIDRAIGEETENEKPKSAFD
jgi:hypothetical protein